jgi:hypothetical protein
MAERDDTDWFETLAGRMPPAGADPAVVKEAAAVRAAARAVRKAEPVPDLNVDAGLEQLLFRLRKERLAEPVGRPWRLYSGLALAATIVLAVGVVLLQPQVEERPVYRGGPAPQVLTSPDPRKLGAAIIADLDTLGMTPRLTQFGATVTIEVTWPEQPDPRHTAFLKRHGLKPPPGSLLVVEIFPAKVRQGP